MSETTEFWSDEDLAEVVRRELQLLEPECPARPAAVLALLHPGFLEFGASGRRWDAASTVEASCASNSAVEGVQVIRPEAVWPATLMDHAGRRDTLEAAESLRHLPQTEKT